jgi:imidazole glycerol-phosphate synthase subunit HisH
MIVIVDYQAGNLTSVQRALDHLSIPSVISPDPATVMQAERIIFPGVGHATSAMEVLNKRGLDKALRHAFENGTPILGICLGTQIILSASEETPLSCLGLIGGTCPKFSTDNKALKIPHIGWDSITMLKPHPVLSSVTQNDEFYFVHSYYPCPDDPERVVAVCDYGVSFPAVIAHASLVATQFHPEKSGEAGLRILQAFAQWDGVPC